MKTKMKKIKKILARYSSEWKPRRTTRWWKLWRSKHIVVKQELSY